MAREEENIRRTSYIRNGDSAGAELRKKKATGFSSNGRKQTGQKKHRDDVDVSLLLPLDGAHLSLFSASAWRA